MAEARRAGAVLFADACDSTGLYGRVGDARALALLGELIERLQETVRARGGEVVRSKGDDVLCVFDDVDAALDAACDMLELTDAGEIAIHIGVHWGEYVPARGDIFGDAVNLAARLLALATPGELMASEQFYERLSPEQGTLLRRIGSETLKGKDEPVTLYSLLSSGARTNNARTSDARATERSGLVHPVRVRLRHGARELGAGEGASLSIGRSSSCDCVVAHASVSRRHATIAVKGGVATISDSSSTGTFVTIGDQPAVMLRRNALALAASGTIALAGPPDHPDVPILEFAVEVGGRDG